MGFSRQIMEDWGNKTSTSVLRGRLEKAGNNWVNQKSQRIYIDLASGIIEVNEAAGLIQNLEIIKVGVISRAMSNERFKATP